MPIAALRSSARARRGLARLEHDKVAIAAIHCHGTVAALAYLDANIEAVRIGFARREQGLMVAPGKPSE
jgi:putative molybdopterin biosynthesis protein